MRIFEHVKLPQLQFDLKAETTDISKHLKNIKKRIHSIFHFGEFARIYQSFKKFDGKNSPLTVTFLLSSTSFPARNYKLLS